MASEAIVAAALGEIGDIPWIEPPVPGRMFCCIERTVEGVVGDRLDRCAAP